MSASFVTVVDTVAVLVESIGDDQWGNPTPCSDWTVRELVDHLRDGQSSFRIALTGQAGPASESFRQSGAALAAAFAEPGAPERTVRIPFGEVPGAVALHLQTLEHLVHGWDLARALGRTVVFADALVEPEAEFAAGLLTRLPASEPSPFGPSKAAPAGAGALDRLAALLGRDVTDGAMAPAEAPRAGRGRSLKLKTAVAGAALVVLAATGTALAVNGSSGSSGSSGKVTAVERTENRLTPTAQGRPGPGVIKADGANVFPHSLGYDTASKTFLVGSLKQGKVHAVTPEGAVRVLVDDPEMTSAQAVVPDPRRGRVLVGNVDYGTAERSRTDAPFRVAGVGSYDLETGEQDWCVDLTALLLDGRQHLVSDITMAPDGTAYAVDELTPTIFRIDREGRATVLARNSLLQGELDIPNLLDDVGMTAVEWVKGDQLVITMADGSLVRVPVKHPDRARLIKLSAPLAAPVAGMRLLKDGSLTTVSSGLLTGEPARIQHVTSRDGWKSATVKVTDTVDDPVTSDVTAGPDGTTYALSGGLADLLAGKPNNGFTLTPVKTD
ncbi:TIGR03086 family metal-binding protein [Streptomyces sp. NPDC088387]|uniref:TIGR03086 family metal-binding protein n=1 Tax=Streptomyces sp. NPDC088387 TaxID=3365859 RepID=UPI0038304908